jgi:hypothetical protein
MKESKGMYNVFSPITHSHPLKDYGLPTDWNFWQKVDFQFLEWADEVWVIIPDEGTYLVEQSKGVQAEIKYAEEHNMLVKTYTYADLKAFITKFK